MKHGLHLLSFFKGIYNVSHVKWMVLAASTLISSGIYNSQTFPTLHLPLFLRVSTTERAGVASRVVAASTLISKVIYNVRYLLFHHYKLHLP